MTHPPFFAFFVFGWSRGQRRQHGGQRRLLRTRTRTRIRRGLVRDLGRHPLPPRGRPDGERQTASNVAHIYATADAPTLVNRSAPSMLDKVQVQIHTHNTHASGLLSPTTSPFLRRVPCGFHLSALTYLSANNAVLVVLSPPIYNHTRPKTGRVAGERHGGIVLHAHDSSRGRSNADDGRRWRGNFDRDTSKKTLWVGSLTMRYTT